MMQIYIVGGWVRDRLIRELLDLSMPPADRDFVVVGATEKDLLDLGYQKVGSDFPVFLHPVTHEEYALARTERKTGPGYAGFATDTRNVTLTEDLARRDLTVNAIAFDGEHYIDPYDGIGDIRRRVLRHVSSAFTEDPVRILRCARFAASLPNFTVDPSTLLMMRGMVDSGEADALTGERVYKEMSRAMMLADPTPFFSILEDTGLTARAFASVAGQLDVATLAFASQHDTSLEVRFACLLNRAEPENAKAFLTQIRAPKAVADLCETHFRARALFAVAHSPEACLVLFEKTDAFRRTERFLQLVAVELCLGSKNGLVLERALSAAKRVDAGAVARAQASEKDIASALHSARLVAVKECF